MRLIRTRCLIWLRARAAAQLLGELLLDRANVKVMMRYVSDVRNLQLMMILLKDGSRSIQFEAFHVFKVPPPLLLPLRHASLGPCTHSLGPDNLEGTLSLGNVT